MGLNTENASVTHKLWTGRLPKLTVILKYLVVSTMCFESSIDPVKKLSTEPAPFAYKRNKALLSKFSQTVYWSQKFIQWKHLRIVQITSRMTRKTRIVHFLHSRMWSKKLSNFLCIVLPTQKYKFFKFEIPVTNSQVLQKTNFKKWLETSNIK